MKETLKEKVEILIAEITLEINFLENELKYFSKNKKYQEAMKVDVIIKQVTRFKEQLEKLLK